MSERLWSIGEISRELSVEVHRVEYVIRTRSIEPVRRIGGIRAFSDAAVRRIASEICRNEEDRGAIVSTLCERVAKCGLPITTGDRIQNAEGNPKELTS